MNAQIPTIYIDRLKGVTDSLIIAGVLYKDMLESGIVPAIHPTLYRPPEIPMGSIGVIATMVEDARHGIVFYSPGEQWYLEHGALPYLIGYTPETALGQLSVYTKVIGEWGYYAWVTGVKLVADLLSAEVMDPLLAVVNLQTLMGDQRLSNEVRARLSLLTAER